MPVLLGIISARERETGSPSRLAVGSRDMHLLSEFFTYSTPKTVVVKCWTVGVLNRVMQLLIMVYFLGWVFWHERAYQTKETNIESSVITKVKGFGLVHFDDGLVQVLDVADYISPPQGASVFCIITAMRITENQVQGKCAEDPSDRNAICDDDQNCTSQLTHQLGNGSPTGFCINSSSAVKTCEVRGWCPVESDASPKVLISGVDNFTIFIKNSIRFPRFSFSKGNMLPSITKSYMSTCLFDPITDPFCPIFRVKDVVSWAEQDFEFLARKGGVIGIKIEWNCNLDLSAEFCLPRYSFQRLDRVSQTNNVSQGYNFRFARYGQAEDGSQNRTLIKAYGIRIDIMVNGQAAKFDIIPTMINIVAAFTSIGLGAVVCDLILLNFLKGAERYKAKKFEEVSDVQDENTRQCLSGVELYCSRQILSFSPDPSTPSDGSCR